MPTIRTRYRVENNPKSSHYQVKNPFGVVTNEANLTWNFRDWDYFMDYTKGCPCFHASPKPNKVRKHRVYNQRKRKFEQVPWDKPLPPVRAMKTCFRLKVKHTFFAPEAQTYAPEIRWGAIIPSDHNSGYLYRDEFAGIFANATYPGTSMTYPVLDQLLASPSDSTEIESEGWELSPLGLELRSRLLPLKPELVEEFNQLAWQKMTPRISPAGFSVINFLLELKDFKAIFKSFKANTVFKDFKKFSLPQKATMKELWTWASELHLTWSFAIKPLLGDLKTLMNLLTNHERILQEYVSSGDGTPQTRQFGYKDKDHLEDQIFFGRSEPVYYDWGWDPWLTGVNYYEMRLRRRVVQLDLKGNAIYTYSAPEIRSFLQYLTAYMDLLGATRNPAIIWNAIPFSFVVDWVYKVGDYLEEYETYNFADNYVKLLDYVFAEKKIVEEEQSIIGSPYTHLVTYEVYDRQKLRLSPKIAPAPKWSDFTTGEMLLSTSLARCLTHRR